MLRGLRFAAMPEHGLEQIARATVMQKLRVSADCLRQADPPQWRGAPVAAGGLEFRAVVGQTVAHVMQQQIAVRANHLIGQFRFGGVGGGGVFRCVARLAPSLEKQILAGQHFGIVDATPRGHGKVAAVEQHQTQNVIADFRLAVRAIAVRCLFAGGLRVSAVIEGAQAGGEAHVTGKRVNILLIEVRLPGFPAKSADHGFLQCVIPDPVRPAVDAVVVFGLRGGVGEDGVFGDRLEQAEADHRWGDACRETRVRVHRAVTQLSDLQHRFAQFDFGAVLEANRHWRVVDAHLAFRGDAGHGHVLELATVHRLRDHADLLDDFGKLRRIRDRQAHQHRHRVGRIRCWRVAATVLDVAVLAGVGVEQRAETIACRGCRGCDHPRAAEKAVADTEIHPARRWQVGRGQGERVLIGLAHGRRTTRTCFTRFGLGETRGVIAGTQAQGQKQCGQAKRQRGHQTSCGRAKTKAQSLTGRGSLNKRNYRLLDVAQALNPMQNPCRSEPARDSGVPDTNSSTDTAHREQAHSYNGPCMAHMKKATRRSPFFDADAVIRTRDQRCPGSGR
ncbi:hypothetical protein EMIT0347P_90035 [Pseudomonas sp. IT-347P]